MKNYRVQNGCWNCKLCFIMREYDEGPILFCEKDAPPRPKCGSVIMGENFNYRDNEAWEEGCNKWDTWSEGRNVEESGICDNWEWVH